MWPPLSPMTFTITVEASGAGVSTPKNVGTLTITVNRFLLAMKRTEKACCRNLFKAATM
jgi:hypothetical protein